MERAMQRLGTLLLSHRLLILVGWLLLCVVGGFFAAGLPGRIVSGGEAPASSQSEMVARALAHSPVPSLFLAIQVSPDATPADLVRATRLVSGSVATLPGVIAVTPSPATPALTTQGARVAVL